VGGTQPPQDKRKLGEGRENFSLWRICSAPWKEGKWGKVPQPSARHCLWACGKVREEAAMGRVPAAVLE
jgi:hypothetical protein